MRAPTQRRREEFRTAAFERANRVQCFHFDHDAAIKLLLQRLRPELRRVEKHRVDETRGPLNLFHGQTMWLAQGRSSLFSVHLYDAHYSFISARRMCATY